MDLKKLMAEMEEASTEKTFFEGGDASAVVGGREGAVVGVASRLVFVWSGAAAGEEDSRAKLLDAYAAAEDETGKNTEGVRSVLTLSRAGAPDVEGGGERAEMELVGAAIVEDSESLGAGVESPDGGAVSVDDSEGTVAVVLSAAR